MIFSNISRRNMEKILIVSRSLEKLQTKYGKVVTDLKHIKTWKKEHLIAIFAKVNFSITNATHKLRQKIHYWS